MTFSYHEVGAISPGDTISVPFGFLDRSHISVSVDGMVVTNWEWINNGLIKATTGIPLGAKTKVYRTTPLTSLPSTLQGASVFDWEGVNLNDLQALFVLQEYVDKEEERNAAIEFVKGLAEALDASIEDLAETILPALALKADKESPALTGSPTTPTPVTDAPDFVIANMEAVRRAFNAITKTSLGLGSVDNVSAANLRDRATHTGQQAMSTITGLVDAMALKASHTDVAEAVAGVVNSSPAALDTLRELATALGDDPNFSATVSTALGNRLRVDLAQSLTTGQKNQAAANLGIAPGATANATDASLRARSSHTGTQSADTITDSATKVVMTATERAKLGAVAEGATANDSDANLKNRANHTGTQGVDTISGIGEWVEDRVAGLLAAGPNITLDYDEVAGRLTIGATGDLNTTAESTTFVPAGGITSTNVQGALTEIGVSKLSGLSGAVQSGEDLNDFTDNARMVIVPTGVLNHPEEGSYFWLDSWSDGNSCTQYARGVYHNSEYRHMATLLRTTGNRGPS